MGMRIRDNKWLGMTGVFKRSLDRKILGSIWHGTDAWARFDIQLLAGYLLL